MSGIAAIVMPDAMPADRAALQAMLTAMGNRGPDGRKAWHEGRAALGFLAFHTTPEAAAEQQPYIDPRSGRVLVLDGRLDNRDELLAALDGLASKRDGDAAFVAAAFERWGTDAPSRLVGDFAFVLWDPLTRRLIGARDVMGLRPFCYARARNGALLVASEVRALLATGLVDDEINEAKALELLSWRRHHCDETMYTSVRRLPPAQVLTADGTGIRLRTYWEFDPGRSVRYHRDEEYAEHARHLLTQAVRAQARSTGRVGILLSGGVDSSALTMVAAADGVDCEALSIVFPGQRCDESRFIGAVTRASGVPSVTVPYASKTPGWYASTVSEHGEMPDYPNGAMLDLLRERASASGIRVLWTGRGGDEWFTGSRFHYADWLRSGAVTQVLRQAASDVSTRGVRFAGSAVGMFGVWPLLPGTARRALKRLARARVPRIVPEWIAPDAARHAGLEARLAFKVVPRTGETHVQAEMRSYTAGAFAHTEEMEDRAAGRAGVEQRNPLLDRRVMEFAYGLPEEQRWRRQYTKRVLRMSVPELPDAVRWRTGKAEFSSVFADALGGVARAEVPRLIERGWIVPEVFAAVRARVHRAHSRGDLTATCDEQVLWTLLGVEHWLEFVTTRRAHGRDTETGTRAFA